MRFRAVARWLLVPAATVVGVTMGSMAALPSARDAEPLVGGAVVVLGAIAGGGAGLLLGALAAWKLPTRWLIPTLWCVGLPALIALGFSARGIWQLDQATLDPEEAYSELPRFVVALERDPSHDPYLAPRVRVDAIERRWITNLPDGRSCSGRLRAAVQRRVSRVLPEGKRPEGCEDAPATGPHERLIWRIEGGGSGAALLDPVCLAASPRYAQLAHVLSIASGLADSAASCD